MLSICRVNGGLREDLTHIADHQSCEGVAYSAAMGVDLDVRHAAACAEAELPPAATALMSTADNMQCAVVTREIYAELTVRDSRGARCA
ncbi:MAG: adenosylcobinamide amidohydrolase [Candidatus Competibacter phosphatis]